MEIKEPKVLYDETIAEIRKEDERRYKAALQNKILCVRDANAFLKKQEKALVEFQKMSLAEFTGLVSGNSGDMRATMRGV